MIELSLDFLRQARESEDRIEFKKAHGGNYSYNGGNKLQPKERRHCVLGYVVALTNEGGGLLVFGIEDCYPHRIVGTNQNLNACGELEQNIYRDLHIRVSTHELYEGDKRVLVVEIPSRPIGKVYKFEDVALMRVGEELLPMSDEKYLKIIQEQEPDFSQRFNSGLSMADLDPLAIQRLKEDYARKAGSATFVTLSDYQALLDLELINEQEQITNAALLMVGRKEAIKQHMPQAGIYLEYRSEATQITFDDRQFFQGPYCLLIDDLWERINLRNGKVPVQQGPRIFDIFFFNQEVIPFQIATVVSLRVGNVAAM